MQKNKWISVKENIPEIGVEVLLCSRLSMQVGFLLSDGYYYTSDNVQYRDITHWMELPRFPEIKYAKK